MNGYSMGLEPLSASSRLAGSSERFTCEKPGYRFGDSPGLSVILVGDSSASDCTKSDILETEVSVTCFVVGSGTVLTEV